MFALLNARFLSNKTFIFNDFYSSRNFLFLTETWLNAGDAAPLGELTPADCMFYNIPRTVGRGGLATVLRKHNHCKLLPVDVFTSFEVQLMKINQSCPVFCAVIYRPPKYNKDFIAEFSEFLSTLVPRCERLVILVDFNIHICCKTQPLVKEFLCMVDAFNLTQLVSGPTHIKGHTLDLVLTSGFHVINLEVVESGISDYSFVLFESLQQHPIPPPPPPPESRHFTRVITFSTVMSSEEIYTSSLSN